MLKYNIFGKVVEFKVNIDDDLIIMNLKNQFDHYEKVRDERNSDIIITITDDNLISDSSAINPSIHYEKLDGFASRYRNYDVEYVKLNDQLQFKLNIKRTKNPFLRYAKKLNNIEYVSREERIPQIIFESILVPSVFFDQKKFIVHSASFMSDKDEVIMLGGTGGVGKTSLGIEFCTNRKFKFVNDDIAIIDGNGVIYPNLALPKIYAYNLHGNNELKKKIFKTRSLIDKVVFELKCRIQSPSKVRRKIDLNEVYSGYINHSVKATKYLILSKQNVDKIEIEKISSESASKINLKIIQSEYSQFFNHLSWHSYNSILLNKDEILTNEQIQDQMFNLGKKAFNKLDCYIVKIPLKIDHKSFVKDLSNKILSLPKSC